MTTALIVVYFAIVAGTLCWCVVVAIGILGLMLDAAEKKAKDE